MDILFKNVKSLLVSADEDALADVDLFISDGKVREIGKHVYPTLDARLIDAHRLAIVPGFANTHHHFYQTLTRCLPSVQDAKLFDWLTHLYEVWKNIDEEAVYYSSLLAMGELLKTGCTLTTDHHYIHPRGFSGDAMALQFEAADRLGMRFSPSRGSMSMGRKDGGLPPDSVVESVDEILIDSERCIKAFHDPAPDAMRKVVLAPCSPFSVSKECMKETAKLAREYGVRLHTHLCETKDEEETSLRMYGLRPVELMEECGLIGSDVFYAHGIHFSDEELRTLKKYGAHISHCPSSNMRLGSGIARIPEMLKMGINVGLGVDGSASNDSSDMLSEMRMALLLSRVKYGSDSLRARDVFKMATVNGAKMLGFDEVGTLKVGHPADLAAFDVETLPYAGSLSDPISALIFCGISHNAKFTLVSGKFVVDHGRLVGVDEDRLANKCNEISARLLSKAGE